MPIDFNRQMIFDPKINIIGKEVPLAELKETGNILQERYDTSRENYNKFQELEKQTEQIADPLERQKVKDYISSMRPDVEQIANNGDYHNMRFQTMAMANNAANNLKMFGERAATLKELKNKIAESKLADPKTRAYYQGLLDEEVAKTQYNADTRTFNFNPITTPNIVADYDINSFLQKAQNDWKANKYNNEAGNILLVKAGDVLPNGTKAAYDQAFNTKTGRSGEHVDFNEVYNNTLKMAGAERGLWNMIDRDVEIESKGKNYNPQQKEALRNELTKKYLTEPLTGASNRTAYSSTGTVDDINPDNMYNANSAKAAGEVTKNTYKEDTRESSIAPGETSNTLSNFAEMKIHDILQETKTGHVGNTVRDNSRNSYDLAELKKYSPTAKGKATLFFIANALSKRREELANANDPDSQKIKKDILNSGADLILKNLREGKNLNPRLVADFQDATRSLNLPMPSAFKSMTQRDSRFIAELDDTLPAKKGNMGEQMKELNRQILGHEQGAFIPDTKKIGGSAKRAIAGEKASYSILNTATGEYKPLNAALNGEGDGLDLSGLNGLTIVSKPVPGTVLNANKSRNDNTSFFANGYVVADENGNEYIIAKHGNEQNNTIAAKYNDLSTFTRTMRDDETYHPIVSKTGKRVPIKIKSNGLSVFITSGNKTEEMPNNEFQARIAAAADNNVDPIDYIYSVIN
jgi:hypothetical protein